MPLLTPSQHLLPHTPRPLLPGGTPLSLHNPRRRLHPRHPLQRRRVEPLFRRHRLGPRHRSQLLQSPVVRLPAPPLRRRSPLPRLSLRRLPPPRPIPHRPLRLRRGRQPRPRPLPTPLRPRRLPPPHAPAPPPKPLPHPLPPPHAPLPAPARRHPHLRSPRLLHAPSAEDTLPALQAHARRPPRLGSLPRPRRPPPPLVGVELHPLRPRRRRSAALTGVCVAPRAATARHGGRGGTRLPRARELARGVRVGGAGDAEPGDARGAARGGEGEGVSG